MNNHIAVSFCIATHERKEMVYELVTKILTYPGDDIEVVVLDNASSDDSYEYLSKIKDDRYHIYQNMEWSRPEYSFYQVLEKGQGRWLFQIVDRDLINVDLIPLLIANLEECEKHNVGFAVGGEMISDKGTMRIFEAGEQTILQYALRQYHPTGEIFYKKAWDAIEDKAKYYYEDQKYKYANGILQAIIGNTMASAELQFDICDKAHYDARVMTTMARSHDCDKGDSEDAPKVEWFWPANRYRLLINALENLDLIQDKKVAVDLLLQRYVDFFFLVTSEFYSNCRNEVLKKRYNRPNMDTNYLELMANGFDYILMFRQHLEEGNYWFDTKDFREKLVMLDNKLLEWLTEWTNEIRNEEGKVQ